MTEGVSGAKPRDCWRSLARSPALNRTNGWRSGLQVLIYVGTREDSQLRHDSSWAIVNTAKMVHVEVKGWGNAPPRDHPHYLAFEEGQFLSFNWVDGASRMYDWSGPAAFIRALDFIDKWYESKNILINCGLGQSRSPTVALLYLAKRLHLITDTSFAAARRIRFALSGLRARRYCQFRLQPLGRNQLVRISEGVNRIDDRRQRWGDIGRVGLHHVNTVGKHVLLANRVRIGGLRCNKRWPVG